MRKFKLAVVTLLITIVTVFAFSGCTKANPVEKIECTSKESNNILNKCEYEGQITTGTKLIVDDGQILVAVKDNNVVDLFETGEYAVSDENVSNLASSEFYYVSIKQYNDIEWKTVEPVRFEDVTYGELYIRANGSYSYTITDPVKFVTVFLAGNNESTVDNYINNIVVEAFEKGISNNNGTKYTKLMSVGKENLIDENIVDAGINFTVKMDILTLTEESKNKIESAYKDML